MQKEHNRLWDFRIMEEIGRGETGIVYRVMNRKNNTIQALKKIPIGNMTDSEKSETYRELKILQRLSHPNVVSYHESFISAENLYIVMEYANKGDLLNLFTERRGNSQHFKESELMDLFKQLAQGLEYLHEQKIMHRDLKLQNIFVHSKGDNKNQRKQVLIGDLGLSRLVHEKSIMETKRVGTPIYFAPEMIQHQPYSFPVDLWALGCVFYSLTNLRHPFQHAILQNLAHIILTKPLKPIKSFYSQKVCLLISRLLEQNPEKRIDSKQLVKLIGQTPKQNQIVKVFSMKYYSDLRNDALTAKRNTSSAKSRMHVSQTSNRTNNVPKYYDDEVIDPEKDEMQLVNMKDLLNTVKCMRPSSIGSPVRELSRKKYEHEWNMFGSIPVKKDTPIKILERNKAFDYVARPLSASYRKRIGSQLLS